VGISNLFSGVMGGYTGSYIFSQTLFSLRRGVKSRVAGAMLAVVELAIIAMPISVTSYLPKVNRIESALSDVF
jgi:sulfate permease, SulP family